MFKQSLILIYHILLLQLRPTIKKSILVVAEYGKSGGTRTYFFSLIRLLIKQGMQITVLDNNNLIDSEIEELIRVNKCNWLKVNFDFWAINFEKRPEGVSKKALLNYQLNELKFWAKVLHVKRFEKIIFSSGYPGLYLYSILLPVKVLYISHSPITSYSDNIFNLLLRFRLSAKKKLVTVSQSAVKDIERYWLYGKKSNYINCVYNYYSPKYQVESRQVKKDQFVVLTIGSVELYKNPYFFIEVANVVIKLNPDKNIKFIWAGEGSLLNNCREKVNDNNSIQFIGFVENVEALYEEADIYFQPSILESQGIAVLGAMYHNIACIVSDQGGLKESVVNNYSGFIVEVDTIDKAVEKVIILFNDIQMRNLMGSNGNKIYFKKFTQKKWEAQMINML